MGGLGSRVAAGGCRLSSSAVTVAEAPSVAKRTVKPNAPVAQWIEQRFPKPRAQVRFLSGALAARPLRKRAGGHSQPLSGPTIAVPSYQPSTTSCLEMDALQVSRTSPGN